MRRKYGIGLADFEALLRSQGGGCAICGCPPRTDARNRRTLHIDHDHYTGKIRGLLCDGCNKGIGCLGDDPERLEAAARYVRSSR